VTNWEKYSGVSPGAATRLFDAANGVLAHEPSGSRVWCVDIRTEVKEENSEGNTYRVFCNGTVETAPPEGTPNSPDEPRRAVPFAPPVVAPDSAAVTAARQIAKALVRQLANDFQLAGTNALTHASGAASTAAIVRQHMGAYANEVSEILKDLADGM
jgi:hypothetical protein